MSSRRRFQKTTFIASGILLWLAVTLPGLALEKKQPQRLELSPPPVVKPDSLSVITSPGGNASLSVDNPANVPDYMTYEPYNVFPREIDLWNLEGKRLIQSPVVVSPDKNSFVYTEVLFVPHNRQTISKLYWVPVPPLPQPPLAHLPSEEATNPPPPPIDYSIYSARFDPVKTTRIRKGIADVGFSSVRPFRFQTLTVVDWSNNGKRLLFKERSGILHLGLRTTNILIYDQDHGSVTIYPEVQRVIKYYWATQANLPHIDQLAWDIQPLGWEPDSDEAVLLKAWAYDQQEKKYLGLWRYNIAEERTQLVSLSDDPPAVAANGWLPKAVPPPPQKDLGATLKERLRHPFSYDKNQPATPKK